MFKSLLQDLIIQDFVRIPKSASLLLFVSGFSILGIQILGVRVLGVYFGTAIPVWAAIIGVILTGSMVGYYAGGAVADRVRSTKVTLGAVFLAGFFTAIIPLSRALVPTIISVFPHTLALLLSSIVLFLPPTAFLSMLITYVIRMHVQALETIGQVHGDLYTIATIGSIAGVFLTSYVLVPHLTVTHMFYGFGLVTILSGFLYVWLKK
jgi:hypothetical protein